MTQTTKQDPSKKRVFRAARRARVDRAHKGIEVVPREGEAAIRLPLPKERESRGAVKRYLRQNGWLVKARRISGLPKKDVEGERQGRGG